MSKYLAIIDLPDDSKCDGCTLLSEDCCRESGHWFRGWNYDRPTDCPLIPVERVMPCLDCGIPVRIESVRLFGQYCASCWNDKHLNKEKRPDGWEPFVNGVTE